MKRRAEPGLRLHAAHRESIRSFIVIRAVVLGPATSAAPAVILMSLGSRRRRSSALASRLAPHDVSVHDRERLFRRRWLARVDAGSGRAILGSRKEVPVKVLVFDDELAARPGALADVPGVGIILHASADNAEAVVLHEDPDLVCMDFAFRGSKRSGASAVAALRRQWDARELFILGISGSTQGNVALRSAGANDVVRKSDLRERLLKLARKV